MSSGVTTRPTWPLVSWRSAVRLSLVWPLMLILGVGLVAMGVFIYRQLLIAGTLHTPLDDAWIHFRFAENLASGHGMSYNPGVATPGTTSPLWVIMLAAVYRVTNEFIISSKVLGALAYGASIVGIYVLTYYIRPSRTLAIAAALFTALTGRFLWATLSGMETTLFATLTVWAIYLHLRFRDEGGWRGSIVTVVLALATLTRPEAAALFGLVLVDRLLVINRAAAEQPPLVAVTTDGVPAHGPRVWARREAVLQCLAQVALFTVLIGPMVAFNLTTGGSPFPNTFAGQGLSQGGSAPSLASWLPDLDYLREVARSFLRDNFILVCFVPIGLVALAWEQYGDRPDARRSLLPLAWVLGLPLLDSLIAPNLRHHERYLMPLLPLVAMVAVFGMAKVAELVPSRHLNLQVRGRSLVRFGVLPVLIAVALIVGLREVHTWSIQYGRDVSNIDETNVATGLWLRDNTPPDALIATHDIGAIVFLSDRQVLDTVGLVEPGILPYIRRQGALGVEEYVRARKPRYFVSWPSWYPNITENPNICRPIHSAEAKTKNPRSLLPASTMIVYECTWQG